MASNNRPSSAQVIKSSLVSLAKSKIDEEIKSIRSLSAREREPITYDDKFLNLPKLNKKVNKN